MNFELDIVEALLAFTGWFSLWLIPFGMQSVIKGVRMVIEATSILD